MKKLFIIITMLLLLYAGLWSTNSTLTIIPDNLQFFLIPAVCHDITIIVSDYFEKIVFTDDITVPKSALRTGENKSFFLNKDIKMEYFRINGLDQSLYLTRNVRADQFNPRLRLQSLLEINEFSQMYSFIMPDTKDFDNMVKIQLKYNLPLSDDMKYVIRTAQSLEMKGCNFWYPRHLNQNDNVNLVIYTPPNRVVLINNMELGFELESGMRVYRLRFTDKSTEPADLKIVTKQLN